MATAINNKLSLLPSDASRVGRGASDKTKMNAQLIFDKSKKFHIDGQEKNGTLFARVKAVRVDEYVIVDKTYTLDEWLEEPKGSWRKPSNDIETERVQDDYDANLKAIQQAEWFFSVCESYMEKTLTPMFLEQQEGETLEINAAAGAQ